MMLLGIPNVLVETSTYLEVFLLSEFNDGFGMLKHL
jgi:hypothetical protein